MIFFKKYGSYYNNNENTDMGGFKDNFKQETGAEEMFFYIWSQHPWPEAYNHLLLQVQGRFDSFWSL